MKYIQAITRIRTRIMRTKRPTVSHVDNPLELFSPVEVVVVCPEMSAVSEVLLAPEELLPIIIVFSISFGFAVSPCVFCENARQIAVMHNKTAIVFLIESFVMSPTLKKVYLM
jgi:hypothetical protein